jgi:hypothetical protein
VKKDVAEVRAVDGDVTARAIAARLETEPPVRHARLRGMRIAVALQTDESRFSPYQQKPGHRTVRRVADGAAFNAHGGVFEYKRAMLVSVTVRARFPSRLVE